MSWFVVATKPNSENLAAGHLARQGFAPYVPQIKTVRRHARRVEMVKRPLFPGYMFVELDPMITRWRSINGTVGVKHILSNAGRPQVLASEFIETLMAREHDGFITVGTDTRTGDVVRVRGGAFDNLIGEVLSVDQRGRLRLLMQLIGRDVVSTIPVTAVEKEK